MKKTLSIALLMLCGLLLPAATPQEQTARFNAATENVDTGGEMLFYQNNQHINDLLCNQLPAIIQLIWADEDFAPTANQAVASLLRLINPGAFQAFASSSREAQPGVFVFKSFILTDMSARSIFIDPQLRNQPFNWQSLPADTRLALKTKINFAHIYNMIYAEISNNQDIKIQQLATLIQGLESSGISISRLCASLDGDFEVLVTGTSMENAGFKIVVPDKNGSIAALLKTKLPPQNGSNVAKVPFPLGEITVIYQDGRIVATNRPELLEAPAQSLLTNPLYKNFTTLVPADGCGYFLLDIPQEVISQLRALAAETPCAALFDTFVKPSSALVVFQVKDNGYLSVTASNFSLCQMTQSVTLLSVPAFAAIGAILDRDDDADDAADDTDDDADDAADDTDDDADDDSDDNTAAKTTDDNGVGKSFDDSQDLKKEDNNGSFRKL